MARPKPLQVDNTKIIALFESCQKAVALWNEQRGENNGSLEVTLEIKTRRSTQLIIRLDPSPPGSGRAPGRMTMLQIEYDPDAGKYMGHTPGVPIDNRLEVTFESFCAILQGFDP